MEPNNPRKLSEIARSASEAVGATWPLVSAERIRMAHAWHDAPDSPGLGGPEYDLMSSVDDRLADAVVALKMAATMLAELAVELVEREG